MDNEDVCVIVVGVVIIALFVCWTVCVLFEERSDYEVCVSGCPRSDTVIPTVDCIEGCLEVLRCVKES